MSLSKLITQLDKTFANFPSFVWVKDLDFSYQYGNNFFNAQSQYKPKHYIDKKDLDLHWCEFADINVKQDQEAITTGLYNQLDFT